MGKKLVNAGKERRYKFFFLFLDKMRITAMKEEQISGDIHEEKND
ncbi:hypothetical protein [Ileibacterium valens]|nr:hypothetical protein [Ileibacterium valens]